MQARNVVLLQSNPRLTQALVASLSNSFPSVRQAQSVEELRTCAAKRRAEVLIVDVEMVSLPEVANLSREFPEVSIVCNHRLADDSLWLAALNAGADDCCASQDPRSILQAALRNRLHAHSMAA
jgi:DNA-binding NarL/FixJ family response regulator